MCFFFIFLLLPIRTSYTFNFVSSYIYFSACFSLLKSRHKTEEKETRNVFFVAVREGFMILRFKFFRFFVA